MLFTDDVIVYISVLKIPPEKSYSWWALLAMWLATRLTQNKSVTLEYKNDKKTEKGMRSINMAFNYIRYLQATLTKQVKDLYDKIFKSFEKAVEKRYQKVERSPWSGIGKIKIVKWPSYKVLHTNLMQSTLKFQHSFLQTLKE